MQQDSVLDKSLLSLSWPIFIDIFLHMATLFINTYMISHISTSMLAATTAGHHFFEIFIPIFNFIGIGCSVVIAQYLGAGNRNQARQAIHMSISFNFILGLLCYLFILFFGYQVLNLMNTPSSILKVSYDYLHILSFCLILESLAVILASCLRVYGRTQVVMYVSLIMNIVTVIGNILVLYGLFGLPELGLVGVAWSTVLGRLVGVILLLILLFIGLRIKLDFKLFFNWSTDLLKKIMRIGGPSAAENLLWTGQILVMTSIVGLIGHDEFEREQSLAAQAIFFQISYFMMLCSIAIGVGNEILVGHLIGAKRFEDAYKRSFKSLNTGLIFTAIIVILFLLIRDPILHMITNDQIIIQLILPLFLISIVLEPSRTQNIIMVNALRATGDATFPFYMAIIFMWGVSIPVGYFCAIKLELGLTGVWIGFACDEFLRGFAMRWRWHSKIWQSKRLNLESNH